MSSGKIKKHITNTINTNKISYKSLSNFANIKLYKLIYLLFNPFYRIKLTEALHISKALNIDLSVLVDIQFDIHYNNQI